MNVGDFVMVINTESIPEDMLGQYALVIQADEASPKVLVEFYGRVKQKSSLSHSAYRSDLMKAGVSLI